MPKTKLTKTAVDGGTMIQRIVIPVAVLAGVFVLAACGESEPTAPVDPSISGNVLHLGTLCASSVASLQSETVVVVGGDSDNPEYLFHWIVDGILTDDGFWVANLGSNEIRFYSSDGSFRFALGGAGDGPGQFRSLSRIFLLEPDSLLAFDAGGRITEFGPERQVVRTFNVPWSEDGLETKAFVYLGAREFAALINAPRDPRQHVDDTVRDVVELVLVDASGGGYRRTGVLLPDRWWTFTSSPAGLRAKSQPDGPSTLLATLGPNLVTSTSENLELRVWATDALDPALLSGEDLELEQGETVDITPRVIDSLVGLDDGGLWVGLHPAGEDMGTRWIWIDGDSEIVGCLDLPKDTWLLDARGNQLLVNAADSLGNQIVQVLEVR